MTPTIDDLERQAKEPGHGNIASHGMVVIEAWPDGTIWKYLYVVDHRIATRDEAIEALDPPACSGCGRPTVSKMDHRSPRDRQLKRLHPKMCEVCRRAQAERMRG